MNTTAWCSDHNGFTVASGSKLADTVLGSWISSMLRLSWAYMLHILLYYIVVKVFDWDYAETLVWPCWHDFG